MKCPACGIGEEHQVDAETPGKTQCTGCGTIFFDRSKRQ